MRTYSNNRTSVLPSIICSPRCAVMLGLPPICGFPTTFLVNNTLLPSVSSRLLVTFHPEVWGRSEGAEICFFDFLREQQWIYQPKLAVVHETEQSRHDCFGTPEEMKLFLH